MPSATNFQQRPGTPQPGATNTMCIITTATMVIAVSIERALHTGHQTFKVLSLLLKVSCEVEVQKTRTQNIAFWSVEYLKITSIFRCPSLAPRFVPFASLETQEGGLVSILPV